MAKSNQVEATEEMEKVNPETENKETPETAAKEKPETANEKNEIAENQNKIVKAKHQNEIYFRGVVRSISQQLDEEDRVQNATIITTTPTIIRSRDPSVPTYTSSGLVTIFWGDNERAQKKLKGIEVGDHLVIKAQLHTYQTDISRGNFYYGMTAEKAVPGGITGLGEYEADRNEAIFIGTLKSTYLIPNSNVLLMNLVTHTRSEGHDVHAHPTFHIRGLLLSAYNRNLEKFKKSKRIGAACEIRQRIDKRVGKEINEWSCFALMYEDENGEMQKLDVPTPPRRRTSRGRRVRAMARSTAENDLNHIMKSSGNDEEAMEAVASDPSNDKMEDVLEAAEEPTAEPKE